MTPVSPVLTEELVPDEVVYAKDQPQYNPLPVLKSADGVVLSRWKPTDAERMAISQGADILLSVHTFNLPLQPVRLETIECARDLVEIVDRLGLLQGKH